MLMRKDYRLLDYKIRDAPTESFMSSGDLAGIRRIELESNGSVPGMATLITGSRLRNRVVVKLANEFRASDEDRVLVRSKPFIGLSFDPRSLG